jgi:putative ABC transport system permease protein
MFFVTYVRRELRRRTRQAIFIALGLALGVGLVVTVAAASAGVANAQATVLGSLYGVATDVTVTGPNEHQPLGGIPLSPGPHGPQYCAGGTGAANSGAASAATGSGKCISAAGLTFTSTDPLTSGFSFSQVAAAARLPGVAAAAGGILLSQAVTSIPKSGGRFPYPTTGYVVDGVDTGHPALGPLGSATLISGRFFTAADANADVAVVDEGYAKAHGLTTGAALMISHGLTTGTGRPVAGASTRFTVIGIVRQAAGNPPSVYIPLKAAEGLPKDKGLPTLKGEVNRIYLAASSAAAVAAVTREVTRLLPGADVASATDLASEVTGSVNSAAKLANDLGRWLAVLVLIAAFAVASLLTTAAVARRAAEFGTLKALGWRTRRIIAQLLGESAATGIAGAAAGVALGYAGVAIIAAVAPSVSATAGASTIGAPSGGTVFIGGSPVQTVAVPLHPSVSTGMIALAVLLALAGALLASALGSWRIARLRPADALSRVA